MKLLSPRQFAKKHKVHFSTVYRWIEAGSIDVHWQIVKVPMIPSDAIPSRRPVNGRSAKRLIGKCERCNWSQEPDILVIHHRNRDSTVNDIDNLELLCWNCHMLEHFQAGDGPFNKIKV